MKYSNRKVLLGLRKDDIANDLLRVVRYALEEKVDRMDAQSLYDIITTISNDINSIRDRMYMVLKETTKLNELIAIEEQVEEQGEDNE